MRQCCEHGLGIGRAGLNAGRDGHRVLIECVMRENLFIAAGACLAACGIEQKCALARSLDANWQAGLLTREGRVSPVDTTAAGRPKRPELVDPAQLAQRKIGSLEGRAALIHAVAHIEFNAINLACDAVYRFRDLPDSYYGDWLAVTADEARHFSLLEERLRQLGYAYGDFPAHNGLWGLAVQTADDPLRRMALVPRVMEARGLDVTPGMMKRFEAIGDHETVEILAVILRDEVAHVAAGSRWFRYLCQRRGLAPEATYFELLGRHLGHMVRGPLHTSARREAGFSESELEHLEALCENS